MNLYLTKVKLAVEFFTVDDVETVRYISHHVTDLKIEPLVVVVRIYVRIQNQVIFKLTHLQSNREFYSHSNVILKCTSYIVKDRHVLSYCFFNVHIFYHYSILNTNRGSHRTYKYM